MAYHYNHTDLDEYNYNQVSNEKYFLPQDYEPTIYNLFDYDHPTPYNNNYNHNNIQHDSPSWSSSVITTAYSTFTPTEPKSVQYSYHEPKYYQIVTNGTFYNQTVPSNPTSEFNSPDFEEYDPTPYGGGYDIVQTYGRPLPPSQEICYSRDGSKAPPPLPPPPPPPEKKEVADQPRQEPAKKEEEKRQPDEKEVEISQIPSGYGLEAMELCGSLFGYWPCATRYYAKRENGGQCQQNACRLNGGCNCTAEGGVIECGRYQESGAADYLFGSLDPYVERRDGGGSFGQPIHCYDRHYQEQPLSIVQFDDQFYDHRQQHCYQDENSWGVFG